MTQLSDQVHLRPEQLDAFWMPFTANRQFKQAPRMLTRAEGMHFWTDDGRQILDGISGLWCCNAGHNRKPIVEAIQRQAATLDFAPPFQMAHPLAFELANRLVGIAPRPATPADPSLDHVFFCNSGSEAVDTALKIALAWQRVRGEGSRTRLIGRERGYHGVGFGGISVGGIVSNRKMFGTLLAGVDHLPHTHDLEHNAYSVGQPEWGAHLADELERIVTLHDASTIAAVIVEPVAGSTGVLIPPIGYLQRLRDITRKHGILLIFDEVICGFGRLGAAFGANRFGVVPDMITFAKGVTSGTVPMGGVLVSKQIHQDFMVGPPGAIELFHGYTYSAHPLACAAALATLDVYRDEALFERAASLEPVLARLAHGLKGRPHVIDVRNLGFVAAVELEPRAGQPGARAFDVFLRCFEQGVLVRTTGDTIAFSPALIASETDLERMITTVSDNLAKVD
ncbi:aspartate aminotransferase family protein [Derxia gummosa]|uniref:Aspartate aminotransferase family protein n=1 Tax=Derxia gummosa DSM 723 TaxID=1121388 RepID=A0A8B6XA37_9BURK|nr:aspartate aminotransferase family protein [Derxia gummosa]